MSYRINTEKYYQRFIDLQEKLRKSEEERLKLEIRLNKMMQIIQTEEQRHYENLSSQYKQFWEEDKKRQDRNNYILRILDRVENQSEALEEKARRLSTIRDQYYGMPRRHYDDSRPSYINQQFYDNDSYNPSPERDMYSPLGAKEYNMNKNFNLQHQEKMEYLNKYLENIDTVKNNENNGAMKSPKSFSSKSPIHNKTTTLKLDDLRPSTDLGYTAENFLTNRYAYQKFNDDDSTTSTPSGSPRDNETPSIRNRSKSPKSTRKFEMDDLGLGSNANYHFDENTRISRFPRRINRRNKQIPKNVPSSDYKNSLKKLQKIQENSRKILSQHIPRTNSYRNEGSNYHKRPMLYQNDLIWNYPVASDFGLNMNDIYQADKVIQKYLMEKYNTYLSDRYLPNPCDSYHDRMNFDNLPHHTYRRHDYIRDLPNRYQSTSHVPNDYFTYPRSPRTYNETHLTSSPTLNKLDEHYSKPPKGNHISGSDNALRKYDELRKDEKTHGIHFNDNDQILEYDKNKPSREYDKKYELNKNYKEDNISLNETNGKYDFVDHERDRGSIKQTKDHDKDEDTSLSLKDNLNIDENTNASSNYSNNEDDPIKSEGPLKEQTNFPNVSMKNTQKALDINSLNNQNNITSNLNSVEKPTMNGDVKDDIDEDKVKQNTIPSVETIIPEEVSYKSFSIVEPVVENDDVDANNIKKSKDSISLISPEESMNKDTELIAGDKQINEDTKSDRDYEEKNVVLNQDDTESIKTNYNESQLYDENGKVDKLDENQEYGQKGQQIQYDESGQPVPHDQNGPQIQYDENGQPIQYDENGQPIQYDANGQPIQYDQNGQQIQYDDNGQPIQFDENGQPIQYDENGQPIQYDQNGHPVQYDENGQMLQYDANGQLLQYDDNGMPIQYDQNGQPIQYDENGQPLQYDENGLQIHYDANGQPIQYEGSAEPYNEESKFEKVEDPIANQEVNEVETNGSSKANVFEMLDTDTESIKQDTKVSNDSDFELTT